MIAFAFT